MKSILIMFFLIGLAMTSMCDPQSKVDPANELLNSIWVSDSVYGPGLRGELTVFRKKDAGRATIASTEARFEFKPGAIYFSFPEERGKFRGKIAEGGKEITGFWLQPTAVTDSRQAFASPLVLKRVSDDAWRGAVQPLDERFTLFLKIYRSGDGSLVAAFRNPDFNSNGGASLFQVATEGNKVIFSARPNESQPEIRYAGTLDTSSKRLRIFWPDAGRTLELVRRMPDQAENFFARTLGEKYTYKPPLQMADGWTTARAQDVGIDEAALTQVVQRIIDSDPSAQRPSLIHSVLAAHHGKLVLEEYFFGYDRDRPHDLRSAGKTFASVLLGASILKGTKIGPETRIYDLLAGMGPFANSDPRKSQITLAHLMTHTAGLSCNDNDDDSPGNESRMQSQTVEPNWWKFTLNLPMAHDPGTRYAYCSANTNLVGAALTTANKTWLPELFDNFIAQPLQFGLYHWNLMPTDEGYLGGGAFVRPRDLLKVGQAYLNGGVWNGKQIVPASWVKESTSSRVKINPQTTGLDPAEFSDYYIEAEDAYAWHLAKVRSGDRAYDAYEATGNGGQFLIVIPEVDLVVVLTGGNYRQGGIWLRWPNEIVGGGIIPAMKNKDGR